jgi:hypothetical protein
MRSWAAALLTLALLPGVAVAAPLEPVTLYATFRWHQWRETYVEHASGTPASLKEQGPLVGVGVKQAVALVSAQQGTLILRDGLELFTGRVHYNGHLQNVAAGTLSPYTTSVNYYGLQGVLDLGWRFPVAAVTVEPFAGLGYRWWLRSLRGGGGYNEYWWTITSRYGGRIGWALSDSTTLAATGGAQLPLYTTNTADGTTVKPDGQWSGFGELSLAIGHWEHALFYEGLRYAKSPYRATGQVVTDVFGSFQPVYVSQPPSQSDIFGYRLGYRF